MTLIHNVHEVFFKYSWDMHERIKTVLYSSLTNIFLIIFVRTFNDNHILYKRIFLSRFRNSAILELTVTQYNGETFFHGSDHQSGKLFLLESTYFINLI